MLAHEDDPDLRLLVMGALREYPSPENREILEMLLKDPDSRVQTKAQSVKAALDKLGSTDPMTFA